MIRLAICDDELSYQNILKQKILSIFEKEKTNVEISTYSSGEELLKAMKDKKADVIFLDIDMPEMSGLNVAGDVMNILPKVSLVFVTNRDDLVFDALRCNPFKFIRKSHLDEELADSIKSVIEKTVKEDFTLVLDDGKQIISLSVHEIHYIESIKHYVYIYTDLQEYKLRLKLSECEEKINDYGFIKIHNSILVNTRKIKKITSKEVILVDDKTLPISRANADNVKSQYFGMVERYVDGIIT